MKCFWIFGHNWGKWTRPFKAYGGGTFQYSECLDCGRIKSRKAPFQYGGVEGAKSVNKEFGENNEN